MLSDRSVHNPSTPYYMQFKEVQVARGEAHGQRIIFKDRFFNFDFGVKELISQHQIAVEVRATALYGYARFHRDTDVIRTYQVDTPDVDWVIEPGVWNGIKMHLTRVVRIINTHEHEMHYKQVDESGVEFDPVLFPWVCRWPVWLMPKTRQVKSIRSDEYDTRVDRIQEALVSQIAMLGRLDLPARAVLASQDIVEYLVGADMGQDKDSHMNVPVVGNKNTFMGLPVIVCREMTHGAIIV